MWKLVKLSDDKSSWHELATSSQADDLKGPDLAGDDAFIVWAGEEAAAEADPHAIAERIIALNDGRIQRVTIGVAPATRSQSQAEACPGDCFCIVTPDLRRCETNYCSPSGICAWIPCNIKC